MGEMTAQQLTPNEARLFSLVLEQAFPFIGDDRPELVERAAQTVIYLHAELARQGRGADPGIPPVDLAVTIPDDLPDFAYDPSDYRDLGGAGVEPR